MKNFGEFLKDKPDYEDYTENIMIKASCCSTHKDSKGCCCSGSGKGCCKRLELKIK